MKTDDFTRILSHIASISGESKKLSCVEHIWLAMYNQHPPPMVLASLSLRIILLLRHLFIFNGTVTFFFHLLNENCTGTGTTICTCKFEYYFIPFLTNISLWVICLQSVGRLGTDLLGSTVLTRSTQSETMNVCFFYKMVSSKRCYNNYNNHNIYTG